MLVNLSQGQTGEVWIDEMTSFTKNKIRIYVRVPKSYGYETPGGPVENYCLLRPDGSGNIEAIEIEEGVSVERPEDPLYFLEVPRSLFLLLLEGMNTYAKKNGIEPDSLAELKALLRAKEDHLEDLRALLEQKLGAKLPNRRVVRNGKDNE